MVRTRHNGDQEDELPHKFISLDHEKSRVISLRGQRLSSHAHGTSPNSDDAVMDSGINVFEEKLVESRLRPRTGPRRAYNYLDADSSDDEIQMRIRQISPRRFDGRIASSRSIKEEMMEDEEQRFRRKSKRSPPVEGVAEDAGASVSTRRSMRQKRLIYDTLNQSILANNDRKEKSHHSTDNERQNDSDDEGKEQDSDDDGKEQETEDNLDFSDMYSRVKRKRVRIKRNEYGMPVNDMDSDSDQDETNCNNSKQTRNSSDDEDEDEDGKENKSSVSTRNGKKNLRKREPQQTVKSYSLREHKPRTVLYKAPVEEKRHRKIQGIFDVTPTKKTNNQTYQSPALRRKVMKRSAFHSSSSSTSSSDGESNDEKSFKRRKSKSMAKARSRMMPMNFSSATPSSSVIKDRVKSGASLADVEPMNIDKNINFNSIGGLGKHIRALKEMVVFPLLYDKVFQRFKVDPPRGVLFYGPPGTGKTLVARALANECSQGDKRVAFFMRKGADCLSKWVGESERQLRLLFDQAYKFRPSIIFFDEIDGLAPVRSSRQDQIHSSIVSTLLALMDGLDSRGEIVVIGATNRIDSLDPALRRPGRFDREFLFPLPTLEARKQILKIQTSSWTPKLNDVFIGELAEKCVGYCGADLKALCTEAAMLALRRRYPQIYISNEALQVDESSINISAKDFFDAINNIIPTSQRASDTPARALPHHIVALLQRQLDQVMNQLREAFPSCLSKLSSLDAAVTSSQVKELAEAGVVWDELASDEDEDAPSIFVSSQTKGSKMKDHQNIVEGPSTSHTSENFFNFSRYVTSRPATFRPRILLTGEPGQGQTTYIAPAVIHRMEDLPVHVLDLPALYAVTAKTPEESCANVFHEAKRKSPSIIYLPYINQWWDVMGETLRATLLTLIHDLNPSMPLLLLATSEQPYKDLDPVLQTLFSQYSGEVVNMTNPNSEERRIFFKDLLLHQSCKFPPQKKQAGEILELLQESKRSKLRSHRLPRQSLCRRVTRYSNRKHVTPIPSIPFKEHSVKYNTRNVDKNISFFTKGQVPKIKQCVEACKDIGCAINSVHPMKLRPRGNYSKLNRNDSARQSRKLKSCCILKSKKSRIEYSMRNLNKPFVRQCMRWTETLPTKNIRLIQTGKCKSSFTHLVREQSHRAVKMEEVAGPSGHNIIRNSDSLSHSFILRRHFYESDHHLQEAHRLTSPFTSGTLSSCSKRMLKRSKEKSKISQSILPCGSAQMLYKKKDKQHKHKRGKAPLPITFWDYTTSKTLTRQYKRLSAKFANCQKLKISRSIRAGYILKPRSKNPSSRLDDRAQRMLEVLPKAPPVKPRELTDEELKQLVEKEELTLMELRIFLRDVLNKLGSDRKFSIFAKPVNIEDAPDYLDIIEKPMDLSTMMSKIDLHEYTTVHSFMEDIDLICSNALEYNPNRGTMDRIIRHRACALKDTAYAIIKTELDKDFEKMCLEIQESRKRRGVKSSTVPNYYYTKAVSRGNPETLKTQPTVPSYLHQNRPPRSIPEPEGERFSRRVRGLNTDPVPSLEDVERIGRMARASNSPMEEKNQTNLPKSEDNGKNIKNKGNSLSNDIKVQSVSTASKSCDSDAGKSSSSVSKGHSRRTKCIWCKPRRKRRKLMFPKTTPYKTSEEDADDGVSQEDEQEETEDNENPVSSFHQTLSVDVSDNLTETDELISSTKKSSRISSPLGVVTRRQSLSPRIGPTSQKKNSDKKIKSSSTEAEHHNIKGNNESPLETQLGKESSLPKECSLIDSSGQDSHFNALKKKLRDSLLQGNCEKPSVVKRLDLDAATLDSGAGSSLESNGDSRDSTDHKLEKTSTYRINSETADMSHNCNLVLAKQAANVLNEQSKKLEVPTEKLTSLLRHLVHRTDGYSVERLEKIYSCLSQIIYRHRHSYNRTNMVQELEEKVDKLPVFCGGASFMNHSSSSHSNRSKEAHI